MSETLQILWLYRDQFLDGLRVTLQLCALIWPIGMAAQADLLRRLGRLEEAAACYREALELTDNLPERRFLERRLREVGTPRG